MKKTLLLFILTAFAVQTHAQETSWTEGILKYTVLEDNTVEVGATKKAADEAQNIQKLTIPETVEYSDGTIYTVTKIAKNGFDATETKRFIESAELPKTITCIGDFAFYSSYVSSINIPESVTEIGNYAFAHCNFEGISLPTTLSKLGKGAFSDCYVLQTVNIPPLIDIIKELQ